MQQFTEFVFLLFSDEYTRITTPRSDVLFKKGYLTRPKKYDTPTTANTSSNGSASVSVTSTDESASYYQSISPETTAYMQPSYVADGYEQDLSSMMYSNGFYGQSGYFYVNREYFMLSKLVTGGKVSLNL